MADETLDELSADLGAIIADIESGKPPKASIAEALLADLVVQWRDRATRAEQDADALAAALDVARTAIVRIRKSDTRPAHLPRDAEGKPTREPNDFERWWTETYCLADEERIKEALAQHAAARRGTP